jgi:ABC-2 type transport system permease protein
MSTATVALQQTDRAARAAADRAPSVARLVEVELRKAVDTRAGVWLLAVTAALSAVLVALRLGLGDRADRTMEQALSFAQLPVNLLVPVIGILLVTSEWSQRTALTTFGLVPHRGRVIGAKMIAMLVLAVATTVVAAALAWAGFAIGHLAGVTSGGWTVPAAMPGQLLLAQCLGMLLGAGFGLLLLNSAAAIVLNFVLPTVWTVLGSLVSGLRTAAEWLDTGRTMGDLFEPAALTTRQWEQLAASSALWILLPIVLGLIRLRRKEIA